MAVSIGGCFVNALSIQRTTLLLQQRGTKQNKNEKREKQQAARTCSPVELYPVRLLPGYPAGNTRTCHYPFAHG